MCGGLLVSGKSIPMLLLCKWLMPNPLAGCPCSHSAAAAYFIVLQIVKMHQNGLRTRPAQFGTSIFYDFMQSNLGFQILLWQLIVMCINNWNLDKLSTAWSSFAMLRSYLDPAIHVRSYVSILLAVNVALHFSRWLRFLLSSDRRSYKLCLDVSSMVTTWVWY